MEDRFTRNPILYMMLFITFVLLVAVLKITASFCLPIILSILLSFVFYPLCKKLNKLHIPWLLCILVVFLISASLIFGIGNLLFNTFKTIAKVYPRYEQRFTDLYQLFCDTFKIHYDQEADLFTNLWNSLNVRTAVQNIAISLSSNLVSFVKVFGVVLLLMLFLLIEVKSIKPKVNLAFSDRAELQGKIKNIASSTAKEVTHYISIKFLISLLTGLLVFLVTFFAGLDFSVIWGAIAFVLNFIPTFGSIISWAATTIFALLQFYPSWGTCIFIAIAVLAINFILGNIIEPRWEGSDLGLSPFVILVSLSFWGWMWGFVGMILAVPMTVIMKIIFENSTVLKPIAILLGNTGKKNSENGHAEHESKEVNSHQKK
ncbi:MAG: AI-2E family transporter [Treponema sp.]|nr:AI-2E family transporter [Treponema sp.]